MALLESSGAGARALGGGEVARNAGGIRHAALGKMYRKVSYYRLEARVVCHAAASRGKQKWTEKGRESKLFAVAIGAKT